MLCGTICPGVGHQCQCEGPFLAATADTMGVIKDRKICHFGTIFVSYHFTLHGIDQMSYGGYEFLLDTNEY